MPRPSSQPSGPPSRRSVLLLLGTYSPAAHRGVARFAAENNWHLHADMARIPIVPHGWRGDGIVAGLGEWDEPVEFLKSTAVRGIPAVDIYRIRPEVVLPRVIGDHCAVGREAAEHLLGVGWQRFGWFSRADHPVSSLRREGFRNRVEEAGFAVVDLAAGTSGADLPWQVVRDALVRDLRRTEGPLGVLAFNDFDAAFVEDACLAANLAVPDDVGIIGVDNNELVVNCVPVALTSVKLDHELIGYEGAALLQRLMDGGEAPEAPRFIPPKGVAVRASTDGIPSSHPLVRQALRMIRDSYSSQLCVETIADGCGVPRRTLETAFRQSGGPSLHQRLIAARLRAVCRKLEDTQETIESIALACGFSHGPHLHAEFRRRMGCSPRAWRLRQRESGSL